MTHPGDGQGGWGPPQYPPTGGFPQQQQPSQYGGLGVFSGGPPEPPKRARWPIIAVVVLFVLVAGGVTTFFLTRKSDNQAVATSSTSKPAPTTPPSSTAPATCEPHAAEWKCLPVASLSLSYDVPKTWRASEGTGLVEGLPDVKLIGITTYGDYECGGKTYNRGNTGGAVVAQADPGATAKDIAGKLSAQYYKSGSATVTLSEPRPVTIPNTTVTGVQVDSVITTAGNECLASKGTIKVLVLQGNKNLHVFMANGDLEGGSSSAPAPVPDADLQAMVDSVKPLKTG